MGYEVSISTNKDAKLKKIVEELNGNEEATLILSNTSAHRTLVATDQDVVIKWNTTTIFEGRLTGSEFFEDILEPKVYNKTYEQMARKLFTGTYDNIAANTILGAICTAAGVTAGSCPSTPVSVRFSKATCLNAAVFLSLAVNKDFWASDTTFNIGDRGTAKGTVIPIALPKRGTDRAQQRNRVLIRGTDIYGNTIYGEAKSVGWTEGTDRPIVLNEKKAYTKATLDNIAAKKLEELEKESSGVKIPISPAAGNTIYPGDTVTISRPDLGLDGSYQVWKTTKEPEKTTLEVDRREAILERYMKDQTSFEELGIYPISGEQEPPGPTEENLVFNPSFEDDRDADDMPDGWAEETVAGTPTFYYQTAEGAEGSRCVGVGSQNDAKGRYVQVGQVWFPVESSRKYFLKGKVYAGSATGSAEIAIAWKDINRAHLSTSYVFQGTPPTGWEEKSGVVESPSNAKFGDIMVAFQKAGAGEVVCKFDALYCVRQLSWEEVFDEENAIAPFSRRWEGESDTISKETGTLTGVDATASKGAMLYRPYTAASNASVWYGPYKKIGAGDYYAIFMLKVSQIQTGEGDTPFFGIDVSSNTAGMALATRYGMTPNEIGTVWKAFALRFRAQENWLDVELRGRGFTTGKATIHMDWVGVVPADVPLEDTGVTIVNADAFDTVDTSPDDTVAAESRVDSGAVYLANGWQKIDEFTVANVDMDMLFVFLSFRYTTGTSGAVVLLVCLKEGTTYYPSQTAYERVDMTIGGSSATCFFTIPKNMKNKTVEIWAYWAGTPDSEIVHCASTWWGHSPHEHDHTEFAPGHGQTGVTDPAHYH